MSKVREFERRAAECRALADHASTADLRQNYASLANMWEQLARDRLAFFMPEEERKSAANDGS